MINVDHILVKQRRRLPSSGVPSARLGRDAAAADFGSRASCCFIIVCLKVALEYVIVMDFKLL